MDKRRVIALSLLVLLAGVLACWLLWPGVSAPITTPEVPVGDSRTDHGSPLQARAVPPTRPDQPDAASPAEAELPETPAMAGQLEEPTETPITPVYGLAVQRGRAVARFELLDRNDQPLDQPAVKLALYRRVGVHWCAAAASYHAPSSTITCDGVGGEGLDAGDYELEVDVGEYGAFTHSFSVARGQTTEAVLRSPNFRRIVVLRFVRPDGTPVLWLDEYPGVRTTVPPHEKPTRSWGRPGVLRDPPTADSGITGIGHGGRRSGSSGGRSRLAMMATDQGRVYVAVIAGARNTISLTLNEQAWGKPELKFEGEFLESEWSDYSVTLPLAENFDELTAEYSRYWEDDPGYRSLLLWIEQTRVPVAVDIESAIPLAGHVRLLIECDAPERTRILCVTTASEQPPADAHFPMKRQGNVFFHDMTPGELLFYGLYEDGQRLAPLQSYRAGNEAIQRIQYAHGVATIATPHWAISPTVDAWIVHSRLTATTGSTTEKQTRVEHCVVLDLSKPEYLAGDELRAAVRQPDRFEFRWEVGAVKAVPDRRERSSSSTRPIQRWVTAIWGKRDPTTAIGLQTGTFQPGAPAAGIAMRAVAADGTPLPWVECSIVALSEDVVCQSLRTIESKLAESGKRPFLGTDYVNGYEPELGPSVEDEIDPERMQTYLGEEFVKRTSEKRDLAWYARNNAWYDTHRKLETDACGYAVKFDMKLEPGKLYVLYCWSNSRNDLNPDARIVFRATEGLTDIGAITLPGYTE